jgi:ADP-heptose:LPS heptosyltransferase
VVHPGSGSEKKRWPLDHFLEIIGRLRRSGISGVLVTGEAEENIDSVLEKTALPIGWTWIQRPPLIALAGLLKEARLYLGNDSGVTHLAAACGTDVVALFRRDLVDSWRPFGRVQLLFAERVDHIRVDSVWGKMTGLLGL